MTAAETKEAVKPENVPILAQTVYMVESIPIISEVVLTDRVLMCIKALLNDANVRAIFIKKDMLRDHEGLVMKHNGLFDQSFQTAIISLEKIRRQAEEQILWGNKELGGDHDHLPMSFQHAVMFGFLRTVAHEMCHSSRYYNMVFDNDIAAEEEIVLAEAQKKLIALAKTTNIEPDISWGWLESETKLFRNGIGTEEGAEDVEDWIKTQQYLIDNSICWKEDDTTLLTLKSWLRLQSKDANNGEVWDKNTFGVVEAKTEAVVPLEMQQTVLLQGILNSGEQAPIDDIPFDMPTAENTPFNMPIPQPATTFAEMMTQFAPLPAAVPTTPVNWDTANGCMTEMYKRMFTHIFSNGWTPRGLGNGEMLAKALTQPINISDLSEKLGTSLIKSYTATVNGRWNGNIQCDSKSIMMDLTKEGLPKFGFTFDINGVAGNRLFVVQNPVKKNVDGSFSKRAVMAQQGHAMAWVINKDTNTMILEAYWDGSQIQVTQPRKI